MYLVVTCKLDSCNAVLFSGFDNISNQCLSYLKVPWIYLIDGISDSAQLPTLDTFHSNGYIRTLD